MHSSFFKQKKKIFWVYDSVLHSNARLLLCMVLLTIISACLSGEFSNVLWIAIIPVFYLIAKLSAIIVVENNGIAAYTFFRKPYVLQWDEITHYGTLIKGKGFAISEYIYFSSRPLITAPHESLPAISKELIFLSYNAQLGEVLTLCWDKQKSKALCRKPNKKESFSRNTVHLNFLLFLAILFAFLYIRLGQLVWLCCIVFIAIYTFGAVVIMLSQKV